MVWPFPMLFPLRKRLSPLADHCSYCSVAVPMAVAVPSSASSNPWRISGIPGTGSVQRPTREPSEDSETGSFWTEQDASTSVIPKRYMMCLFMMSCRGCSRVFQQGKVGKMSFPCWNSCTKLRRKSVILQAVLWCSVFFLTHINFFTGFIICYVAYPPMNIIERFRSAIWAKAKLVWIMPWRENEGRNPRIWKKCIWQHFMWLCI